MKCKKCGKEGARYLTKIQRTGTAPNRETLPRTDFRAIHKKCGFEGVI